VHSILTARSIYQRAGFRLIATKKTLLLLKHASPRRDRVDFMFNPGTYPYNAKLKARRHRAGPESNHFD
jgi:hypothetical protein